MTKRIFLLIVTTFLLIGCGPPWTVVRQAVPNQLVGKKRFILKPIDFSGLRVGEKSEQGYLAGKDEDTRQSWVGDKRAMNAEFEKKLMGGAREEGVVIEPGGEPTFTIEPQVTWIEPGFYVGVAAGDSEVHLTMLIRDPAGAVVDEITMKHSTRASLFNPAVGNRLRDDAEGLGVWAAEYVVGRTRGE